ncbi:MAG: elongation factor P [Patescibacteria group bacterium]|nr:MAG: elongation factor P [Patescibacteria group bacterium]
MIIKAGNIRKGSYILFKGSPHLVTQADFVSPGKGSAFMRSRLRSIKTGNTQEFTFKSVEPVEEVEVQSQKMQFLYNDGDSAVFMNGQTYEQVEVPLALIGDKAKILTPDIQVHVMFYEGQAVDINFPPKITLQVVQAEEAVAGNTMGTARKLVTVESGFELLAPLFVKEGDFIAINTDTLQYDSRVNK